MPAAIRIKKVVSTKLRSRLMRIANNMRGAQIAARIQVPSDLSWWYWQEFGSASRQRSDAPFPGGIGGNYTIKPIDRESNGDDYASVKVLHWGPEGGGVFAPSVSHPGIRPRLFVRQAIPQIMRQFGADVAAALKGGAYTENVLKRVLMEQTMPYALALIVSNLETAAPGTREDGRLLGNSAAETFEEEAEIVDASDFSPGNPFTRAPKEKVRYVVSKATKTKGQILTKPPIQRKPKELQPS